MFQKVEAAPPDAILGITEAFLADTNPDKINLSVGQYKDAHGKTPVLRCVKAAEQRLLTEENTKAYLPIDGRQDYDRQVPSLLWGSDSLATSNRVASVQTPGGTAALRVAADFVQSAFPSATVWCSTPTWANHASIFHAAGLKVQYYPYFRAESNGLDFGAMIGSLHNVPAGDAVLLHVCCHNPTGIDPTAEQWSEIAAAAREKQWLPILDFAYQGFGVGLEEDALGLRAISSACDELLVCSSFSKNFGLYRERVGALTALTGDATTTKSVLSRIKKCIRSNYSNPPSHGAAIVATVLSDPGFTKDWHAELAEMRDRINGMRSSFVAGMAKANAPRDFSFIGQQRGMFSFSGLTPQQVDQLRDRFAIYVVRDGRINVAGMTDETMGYLCDSLVSVLEG
ncbi:MAG: amino acid aminotransferase [Pirellulaceae bacterium]|nr:aspartate/tyrosine/aromatic aminotransferase [Planctomycetales bacterium]